MSTSDYILVAAPTKAGENFIQLLRIKNLPFVVITNNTNEQKRLSKLGAERFILLDTAEHDTWQVPEYPIGNFFLFEKSLTLCCRYLQIARKWTSKTIYVITESESSRNIYKGLGADYFVYSKTGNVSFLIN